MTSGRTVRMDGRSIRRKAHEGRKGSGNPYDAGKSKGKKMHFCQNMMIHDSKNKRPNLVVRGMRSSPPR